MTCPGRRWRCLLYTSLAGEYVEKGALLGYVAEPTKYYSIEGNNLYFELLYGGQPVDALDFLE